MDVAKLVTSYYALHPDPAVPEQKVSFGTSGHRGSALRTSFNEDHIAATSQAICDYRARAGTTGPLFLGRDTHALSEPAFVTALEVLAANEVTVLVDSRDGYTPTPALSRAILAYNDGRDDGLADGIVITPSHNPPEDGGFKYNPPDGGPAGSQITSVIQDRGQRAAGRRAARGAPDPLRGGQGRRHDGRLRLPGRVRRATAGRGRPGHHPRARASGSAPTRWAAPASRTGRRSPSATGST